MFWNAPISKCHTMRLPDRGYSNSTTLNTLVHFISLAKISDNGVAATCSQFQSLQQLARAQSMANPWGFDTEPAIPKCCCHVQPIKNVAVWLDGSIVY